VEVAEVERTVTAAVAVLATNMETAGLAVTETSTRTHTGEGAASRAAAGTLVEARTALCRS